MKSEIESLTALRGIAAIWVVLYHYAHHVDWVPAAFVVAQGDLAVDLFFTLSGFILVYVYGDKFSTKDFLTKRFARLYPVHFVTLVCISTMIIVGKALGINIDGDISLQTFILHTLALHGIGFEDKLALNYPSWSISAEFFAYLAFPFLARWFLNWKLIWSSVFACTFFAACVYIADTTGKPLASRSFDFSPLRIMPEFLLGMIAARFCISGRVNASFCGAAALLLLTLGLFKEIELLVIMAAPFLIATLYVKNLPVPRFLRYLGVISYSLYMVHALTEKIVGVEVLPFWCLAIVISASILFAAIMYHYVEEPGRRLIMRLYKARTPRLAS